MATRSVPLPQQPRKATRFPRIREAAFRDYPKIAALASRLLAIEPYEEWEHLWVNNPVYKQVQPQLPIGWVLESGGDIVGYTGNILFSYAIDGRQLTAALPRAWMTDNDYRSYSILLLECFFSQQNVDLFIGTTANDKGSSAMEALGSSLIPVPVDESAFWVTDAAGFAQSALTRRNVPAANVIGLPFSFLLRAKNFLRMQLPLRTEEQIRFVTRFDDRFAEFWEELRKRNSHKLLGSRALDVLRWHFHYALEQNRVWILTANDGERLVSYAIFQRADLPQFGLKRMRLVDFQTLNGDRSSLAVMLGLAEKRCRAERIHMLEIYASDELINEPAIRKFAPYSRKTAQSPFFYKTNDAGLAKMLKDPAVWSPSPYDGDLTIGR